MNSRDFISFSLLYFFFSTIFPLAFCSTTRNNTCLAFPVFAFWIRRQCPVIDDVRCVYGLPGDVAGPAGQLNCALADAQLSPRLKIVTADEMLRLIKQRDPWGRPQCLLSFFYSPDCVFSAKVANTFYSTAFLFPKLLILAVDVSAGGKGTESLISHYGISSTPVIALWQDGFPRYRLYEDYSQLDPLVRALKHHTDMIPEKERKRDNEEENGKKDKEEEENLENTKEKEGRHKIDREPSRKEFLGQFRYLQKELGFDWYFLAATLTCFANALYFFFTSNKGRILIRQYFTHFFAFLNRD